jgi:hypothetical protein
MSGLNREEIGVIFETPPDGASQALPGQFLTDHKLFDFRVFING